MFRHDTWTGGEHYFIIFRSGTHALMKETGELEPVNEVIFTGHYEKCVSLLDEIVESNFEYDMNI